LSPKPKPHALGTTALPRLRPTPWPRASYLQQLIVDYVSQPRCCNTGNLSFPAQPWSQLPHTSLHPKPKSSSFTLQIPPCITSSRQCMYHISPSSLAPKLHQTKAPSSHPHQVLLLMLLLLLLPPHLGLCYSLLQLSLSLVSFTYPSPLAMCRTPLPRCCYCLNTLDACAAAAAAAAAAVAADVAYTFSRLVLLLPPSYPRSLVSSPPRKAPSPQLAPNLHQAKAPSPPSSPPSPRLLLLLFLLLLTPPLGF
jgi:hypothetical protein